MAENRIRIQKDLEKSTTSGSIIVTDVSNEQGYLVPGSNGEVLTIVAGVPTYSATGTTSFTLSDGTNTQIIASGNTLTVTSGDGIVATVSATDVLTLAAQLSTDADNSIEFGTDGGLYFNAPDNITSVAWNDTTNNLDITFNINGTPTVVNVPIVDNLDTFISDFTISDGTLTDIVFNHETLVFEGSGGITTAVSANKVTIGFGGFAEEVFSPSNAATDVVVVGTISSITGVYRNGTLREIGAGNDYTVTGNTITFLTPFGTSTNGAGGEKVIVKYIAG